MILLHVFCILAFSFAQSQQCDWSGSGLSGGEKRGVRPVYLRCGEGRVSWSYPEGALRVLLRLNNRNFRACLRPSPGLAASIYLEGSRSLTKIYSPNTTTHMRCFQSRGGQAALYVEAATDEVVAHRPVAEFAYDLQPLPKGKVYDPNEECRPCTKDEMIHAYCTSEIVTRGIIQRVQPVDDETDLSEIVVKETKRLRSSGLEWGGENEVVDRTMVGVARHCGAAHGEGEMVIMARRKLGRLVLICAPRHSEWHAIVRQPAVRDAAHCLLAS
ncbi:meteorin-like protein [Halyomorpha halys]|uniref:meteorin-like protein n=1 Tax=Halyomorpha halys TaxID=286706 RepID=UPI0006D4FE73|nr:meteorin-like protein [Halyomorpha halys]